MTKIFYRLRIWYRALQATLKAIPNYCRDCGRYAEATVIEQTLWRSVISEQMDKTETTVYCLHCFDQRARASGKHPVYRVFNESSKDVTVIIIPHDPEQAIFAASPVETLSGTLIGEYPLRDMINAASTERLNRRNKAVISRGYDIRVKIWPETEHVALPQLSWPEAKGGGSAKPNS